MPSLVSEHESAEGAAARIEEATDSQSPQAATAAEEPQAEGNNPPTETDLLGDTLQNLTLQLADDDGSAVKTEGTKDHWDEFSLEPEKRPEFTILFRIDASDAGYAANFVRRAKFKDFLELFDHISDLIKEDWTDWTRRCILMVELDEEVQVVNHSTAWEGHEIMRLRLLSHTTFLHNYNNDRSAIEAVNAEVQKVLDARYAEQHATLSEEQKIILLYGRQPENQYEWREALDMLWFHELDLKMEEKDKRCARVIKRRRQFLKQESKKAKAEGKKVVKAQKRYDKMIAEERRDIRKLIHHNEKAYNAARERRIKKQTEPTPNGQWNPVWLHRDQSEAPLPNFKNVSKEGQETVNEIVYVAPILATWVDDPDVGLHWVIDRVDEKTGAHNEYPGDVLFYHVYAPQVSKGANMEWMLPADKLREWKKEEQQRLKEASKAALETENAKKGNQDAPQQPRINFVLALPLNGFTFDQFELLEWVSEHRVRLGQEDWSRKLKAVLKNRDSQDEKRQAVPRKYIFQYLSKTKSGDAKV